MVKNNIKNTIYFFVLLISTTCFAQFQSGKVIYEGTLDITQLLAKVDSFPKKFRSKMIATYKNVRPVYFTMIFTKNESLLKKEKPLAIDDEEGTNLAYYQDNAIEIYTNISKNKKLTYLTVMGENTLILAKNNIKWELFNETKKIGDYLCYKAVTKVKEVTIKGDKLTPVIAWYTPQILVPFTPRGFNNLPGLAIQLQFRDFTYTAQKIKLSNRNITIYPPNKGEQITQKEFYQKEREIWEGIRNLKNRKK